MVLTDEVPEHRLVASTLLLLTFIHKTLETAGLGGGEEQEELRNIVGIIVSIYAICIGICANKYICTTK